MGLYDKISLEVMTDDLKAFCRKNQRNSRCLEVQSLRMHSCNCQ